MSFMYVHKVRLRCSTETAGQAALGGGIHNRTEWAWLGSHEGSAQPHGILHPADDVSDGEHALVASRIGAHAQSACNQGRAHSVTLSSARSVRFAWTPIPCGGLQLQSAAHEQARFKGIHGPACRMRLHPSRFTAGTGAPFSASFLPSTHMTGVLALSAFRIILAILAPDHPPTHRVRHSLCLAGPTGTAVGSGHCQVIPIHKAGMHG